MHEFAINPEVRIAHRYRTIFIEDTSAYADRGYILEVNVLRDTMIQRERHGRKSSGSVVIPEFCGLAHRRYGILRIAAVEHAVKQIIAIFIRAHALNNCAV